MSRLFLPTSLLVYSLLSQAQVPSPHYVTLTWVPPTTGATVTGFNVKRASVSGAEVTIGTTTMPTITYIDPFQLSDQGKAFFYVVTSTGPSGESVPTPEIYVIIPNIGGIHGGNFTSGGQAVN